MELSLHLSEDETDEIHPIVEDISKQQPDDINPCGESISCKMKNKNMIKKNLKRPYQDLEDPEIVINEKYYLVLFHRGKVCKGLCHLRVCGERFYLPKRHQRVYQT